MAEKFKPRQEKKRLNVDLKADFDSSPSTNIEEKERLNVDLKADFDSSPSTNIGEIKPSKVMIEGRQEDDALSLNDENNYTSNRPKKAGGGLVERRTKTVSGKSVPMNDSRRKNVKESKRPSIENKAETVISKGKVSSRDPLNDECPGEIKPIKVKIEGRRRLCRLSYKDDNLASKDDKMIKEEEKERLNLSVSVLETDVPRFSGITDFDSPPSSNIGEIKPSKVMIEGRQEDDDLSLNDENNYTSNRPKKAGGGLVERRTKTVDGKSAPMNDSRRKNVKESKRPSKEKERLNVDLKADFDSSPSTNIGEIKPSKVMIEGRQEDDALSLNDENNYTSNRPKKAGGGLVERRTKTVDGKSAPMNDSRRKNVKESKRPSIENKAETVISKGKVSSRDPLNDECPGEIKPIKVKIEGRRRLSRLSYKDDNLASKDDKMIKEEEKERLNLSVSVLETDVPRFSGITDFDSPPSSNIGDIKPSKDDPMDDGCVILSGTKMIKEVKRRSCKLQDGFDKSNAHPKLTFILPGKIAKKLYTHQQDGLNWLWSLHCDRKSGILGDDMGLGKTMQICAFLAGLFHSRLIKRALVVCPATLLGRWKEELSNVDLSEKTRKYSGTNAEKRRSELQCILQDDGVLLTTYDLVRCNGKALSGGDDFTWDYMVLDEAHWIKNANSQRAKSLRKIPFNNCIMLTGTPIENRYMEFWTLFDFCCPGLLGDRSWFRKKFERPIVRGKDTSAPSRIQIQGSKAAEEFRERIKPYFLRREKDNKSDDARGPKFTNKKELVVWLRLNTYQRRLYEACLSSMSGLLAPGRSVATLTTLKQICDDPRLLQKRAVLQEIEKDSGEVSPKISFLLHLLVGLLAENHHVLIFSQTKSMLNLIQESLVAKGFEFLRMDGDYKIAERMKIVNDFQEGKAPIFLLTSKVGGLGLTITKADRVIVVDPAWNPSTDSQSVDRAHRIGQEKDVLVYRLVTCSTIEEKVYRQQIHKGGLFKTATQHRDLTRYFSRADLKGVFTLPKQGFEISVTQQQLNKKHDGQHTRKYGRPVPFLQYEL